MLTERALVLAVDKGPQAPTSRSIPNALTQAESLAGESPSELFERMTVYLLALHDERLTLVEAYEARIAELEAKVKELAHMVQA